MFKKKKNHTMFENEKSICIKSTFASIPKHSFISLCQKLHQMLESSK